MGEPRSIPVCSSCGSPEGLNIRVGPGQHHALARPIPLPDGTKVTVHQAEGSWYYVSPVNDEGVAQFSGWVNGKWIYEF